MDRRHRRRTGAVIALIGVLLAGCATAPPVDRAGGDTLRLRLATSDGDVNSSGQLYGPEAFPRQLEAVSGGRVRVEVVTGYGGGAADAEGQVLEAIRSGALDGGWPATRAFAPAGIAGLQAYEAPMVLGTAAAVRAAVAGRAAQEALGRLDGSGVVGLALAAGPLRRPFAIGSALLGPQDWSGAAVRTTGSPVQAATVSALGGRPVLSSAPWVEQARTGALRGVEFDIAQYVGNGWSDGADFVTGNVVLWPKVFVLSLSEQRLSGLTGRQREWVREAAARAAVASVKGSYDDSAGARRLCSLGIRVVDAGTEQLSSMRAAVAPVIESLRRDPVERPLLDHVLAAAARHPGVDAPDVAPQCQQPGSDDEAILPPARSALPDGVYRTAISIADVARAGVSNGSGWSGTWTLEVRGGTFALLCRPLDEPGTDCGGAVSDKPLEAGRLHGEGDEVTFAFDGEMLAARSGCRLPPSTSRRGHCIPLEPYGGRWAMDGDRLTFTDVTGQGHHLDIEPWQRIG